MVPHIFQYTKNHCFIHCKCVSCIMYEVYLNKAVERKEGRKRQRTEEREREGEGQKGQGAPNSDPERPESPVQSLRSQRRPKVRELRLSCFQTMVQNIKKWTSKINSKTLSKHSYVFQKGSQLVASVESEFDARRTDPARAARRRVEVFIHSEGRAAARAQEPRASFREPPNKRVNTAPTSVPLFSDPPRHTGQHSGSLLHTNCSISFTVDRVAF